MRIDKTDELNELQKKKVKLEINEIKKSWLLKPSGLFPFLTLIGVIISGVFAIKSGVFDAKYQNLQVEKNILTFQILEFTAQRDSLHLINDSLQGQSSSLKDSIRVYNRKLLDKENAMAVLDNKQKSESEKIQSLLQIINSIQSKNSKVLQDTIIKLRAQVSDERDRYYSFQMAGNYQQISELKQKLKSCESEINFIKGKESKN
jgi:uncharacterized protein (DUF3084 family)